MKMKFNKALTFGISLMLAGNITANAQKVTFNGEQLSLKQAFEKIESVSKYKIAYNTTQLDVNKTVVLNQKNVDVLKVLDAILSGTGCTYEISDGYIVITPLQKGMVKKIEGTVKDTSGEPVIGATVIVKGTTNGTVTDFDGNFSLTAEDGATLEISYIGYQSHQLKAVSGKLLTVTLKEDAEVLDEVVVVGYGTQKKVNLTGSVATVDSKLLNDRPIQNVSSALQGLMPGVTITSNGGRPGQDGAKIRVRGVGTLNNADPYILVDGIETDLDSVDPNDIESISVLKDAASAAIYGSKASNGVILITTKRGKEGKPTVRYTGNVGFQKPTNLIERMNSYDYARLFNKSMEEAGIEPRFTAEEIQKFKDGTDPNYPNTDWYDLILKTGFQHSHNVNISGGTESIKFMGSVGYLGQSGILPHSERKQLNARTNLDIRLSSKLSVKLNMAYVNNDYSDPTASFNNGGGSGTIFYLANRVAPWITGRYEDGSYGTTSDGNVLAWLDANQTVDIERDRFVGSASLGYEIIDGLNLSLVGSFSKYNEHYNEFRKYIVYNDHLSSDPNDLKIKNDIGNTKTFDALLTYNKKINKHNIGALLGWHAEKFTQTYEELYRKNFPTNDITDMDAGESKTQTNKGWTTELALLSYFARINYDYAGKYLFEANIRSDASSRFAPGHRWGYFPSFSAAWRLTEESFMENSRSWLTNMKLRVSWGLLGNQNALGDNFAYLPAYGLNAAYAFAGEYYNGYNLGSYKIRDISWEKAMTYGVGVDFAIKTNFNMSVDYYNRKTTGIIMDMPVPMEFGMGAYKDNIGEMRNQGIEVTFAYNKKWNNWSLGIGGNFAYNKNELLNLGNGVTFMSDPNNGNMRRVVGEAVDSYYLYRTTGLFSSDEAAQEWMEKYSVQEGYPFGAKQFKGGDLIIDDVNGDGKITEDDRTICGSRNPKFTYGLNVNVGYKGFDLSLLFTGAAGVKMLLDDVAVGSFIGDSSHPSTMWLDAWTPNNKDTDIPRVAYGTESPSSFQNIKSDFWLNNASYLRLKNIQLGYTFPSRILKNIGVQNLRIYCTVENVFTVNNMMVNVDPEITSENGNGYPLLRTSSLGVNLTF